MKYFFLFGFPFNYKWYMHTRNLGISNDEKLRFNFLGVTYNVKDLLQKHKKVILQFFLASFHSFVLRKFFRTGPPFMMQIVKMRIFLARIQFTFPNSLFYLDLLNSLPQKKGYFCYSSRDILCNTLKKKRFTYILNFSCTMLLVAGHGGERVPTRQYCNVVT